MAMENLLYSVNTVLPLILLGVLGYILRRIGMLTVGFLDVLAEIIFAVSFPCAIFASLLDNDLREVFSPLPVLLICGYIAGTTVLSILLMPVFVKDRPVAASLSQSMIRQSRLAQSIPLLTIMYGAKGTASGMILQPFSAPAENIAAVAIFLVMTPGKEDRPGRALFSVLKSFCTNPQILSCVLGIFYKMHIEYNRFHTDDSHPTNARFLTRLERTAAHFPLL